VGALLLHLSDLVERHYAAVCGDLGVSLTGHSVLTTLRRHAPEELTLVDVNREALVTSGGLTFVVRQLESQGLLSRRTNPDDRRSVLLKLTPKGRKVADNIIAAVAETDQRIAAHIDRKDRGSAEALLRQIELAVETEMSTRRRR
jgi:DNA-binding MarR family transcriptional regulator